MKTTCSYALLVTALITAPCSLADEKSHRKAAEELLLAMNLDKQLSAAIDQMIFRSSRAHSLLLIRK